MRPTAAGPAFAHSPARWSGIDAATAVFRQRQVDAAINVRDKGVSVHGMVDATAVMVSSSQPVVVGGFYVPLLQDENRWHYSASTGAFEASFAPPPGLAPVAPVPSVSLRCDEVTLATARWSQAPTDVLEGLGLDPLLARNVGIRPGSRLAVALTPNGETVATIDPAVAAEHASDRVWTERLLSHLTAYEVQGGWMRVAWLGDDSLVYGWAPAASLDLNPPHTTRPPRARMGATLVLEHWYRCFHEIPLSVRLGGQTYPVGVIEDLARFAVVARRTDTITVATYLTQQFSMVDEAEFVIAASALDAACTPE